MTNQSTAFSSLGASVTISAPNGSSSASTTLPGAGGGSCRVVNENTVPVSIAFSQTAGGATATATGTIVNTGADRVISIPFGTTDVAVWGIGASGNVIFQRGDGV